MLANIIPFFIIIVLFVVLYHSDYTYLTYLWSLDDFNYCIIIPVISLFIIWQKRRELVNIPTKPSWYGVLLTTLAVFCYYLGNLAGEYYTIFLSSWLFVVGFILSAFGWQLLKAISFPLILLLAMFPFPRFINTRILVSLKLISSAIAVKLMQYLGMSVFREGNIIDIGIHQLQVADACSGLRYVIPLIIIGLLMGYVYRRKIIIAIILAISAVPLSILMNSLRIAATGFMYINVGPKVAEGFFHWFSGLAIFTISILLLWLEMNMLDLIASGRKKKRYGCTESDDVVAIKKVSKEETKKHTKWLLAYPQVFICLLLMGLTWFLTPSLTHTKKIPPRESFSHFPLRLGEWIGTREQMDQRLLRALDLSDYLLAIYRNSDGKYVNLYIAYYESQKKGESIHSPSTCLPGSGWVFKEEGIRKLPLPGNKSNSLTVRYAVMEKGASKQVAYYWFYLRGRVLTNLYQVKFYNWWDGLTKHRTDGALIRVVTPVYEGENIHSATRRLNSFLKKLIPTLTEYLP